MFRLFFNESYISIYICLRHIPWRSHLLLLQQEVAPVNTIVSAKFFVSQSSFIHPSKAEMVWLLEDNGRNVSY